MSNTVLEMTIFLDSDTFNPFSYLKSAHNMLSNPIQSSYGRELIIRALDQRKKFNGYEVLLKKLVIKAGLFPYLNNKFEEHSIDEKLLIEIYRTDYQDDFIFHSMQLKIYNYLMNKQNVVLSAPTSMGKSAIVDSIIASKQFSRIVIVVPTIALIDETRRRIAQKFSDEYEIIHHNIQKTKLDKTVYILTQERVIERKDLKNIDLFIIDEFYKLAFKKKGDNERIISLNIALSKLLLASKQFYMIGPNIDDIRGVKNLVKDFVFIPSSFNTVALNIIDNYNINANDLTNKNSALEKILKSNNGQTLIYCKSPSSASLIADFIISTEERKKRVNGFIKWVEKNYSKEWGYSKAIRRGIGIHHGALPRALQQCTVDLFNQKKIKYLICTSTIIEGVNTVAKNVIIYDNRNGTPSIDRFTHNNIMGRAGRMNVHLVGNVHCLEKTPISSLESRVVDIPLGTQSQETPENLLVGVEDEHVQKDVRERYESYIKNSRVPFDLLKKYATYKVGIVEDAFCFVDGLTATDLKILSIKRLPRNEALKLMCKFIKQVSSNTLMRYNLGYDDSPDLKAILSKYIFADSHQDYINQSIEKLKELGKKGTEFSTCLDREFSIVRNVIAFTIPKALALFQDLINYISPLKGFEYTADFSMSIAILENFHLPSNFAALVEMGIPIQTLHKMVTDDLKELDLDELIQYIKMNNNDLDDLEEMDYAFIKRAFPRDGFPNLSRRI